MVLLQDYQQIHEHNSRVYAMFHNNKMVWPAKMDNKTYYIQCSSNSGSTVLVSNIDTNNISISYKALQANTIAECIIGIKKPNIDNTDLRLVIANSKTSTGRYRRFDHGNLQENDVLNTFDFTTTYIVNLEFAHLYMFNCDTNQIFIDSSYDTPTYNVNGDLKLYNVKNSKVYWIKLVIEGSTLFDAEVDANGLYDKVSQQYITPSGWTVMEE